MNEIKEYEAIGMSLITLCVGIGIGMGIGGHIVKQKAVENGAAEYILVDKTTGAVEFKWK